MTVDYKPVAVTQRHQAVEPWPPLHLEVEVPDGRDAAVVGRGRQKAEAGGGGVVERERELAGEARVEEAQLQVRVVVPEARQAVLARHLPRHQPGEEGQSQRHA